MIELLRLNKVKALTVWSAGHVANTTVSGCLPFLRGSLKNLPKNKSKQGSFKITVDNLKAI